MSDAIEELIKTEEGCLQLLREAKYPNGQFRCAKCGDTTGYEFRHRSIIECAGCHRQISPTSGTFFHGMRTPLTKIFAMILDLANGLSKSAFQVSQELELPVTTAWRILHKLRVVFELWFAPDQEQTVHHSFLAKILYRRSIESPSINASSQTRNSKSSVPKQSESSQPEQDPAVCKAVAKAVGFIETIFCGVSRKFSQRYFYQFSFFLKFRGEFRALLAACTSTRSISNEEIESYTSPELVTLPQ